jgi:DNA mismatch repair ATPase MutS
MFNDRDFAVDIEQPFGAESLIQDLELETIWTAMSLGDETVLKSVRTAMLASLTTIDSISYRQEILTDCLRQPTVIRGLYDLAGQAVAGERQIFRSSLNSRGEALLHQSITTLEMFVGMLRQLRKITDEHGSQFRSQGFVQFFATIRTELEDAYFNEISQHLSQLRFRDGILASAELGEENQGIHYVLRLPRDRNRGHLPFRHPNVKQPAFSHTIARDDQAGGQALGDLRDRVLSLVANALAQSADHVLSFFSALRAELAFYTGCLNLHDQLAAAKAPQCLPQPQPLGTSQLSARDLYDPGLCLALAGDVHGNDLRADHKSSVIVTGANQGGKSTFLRSIGVAQLMLQAGMTVTASSFSSSLVQGILTHYKREEDSTMTSGKFDEELHRMSEIGKHIRPHSLLLCNESFAATNEREASEIAGEVIRAMNYVGIRVVFVTHLYDLSHRMYLESAATTLFLRAARADDGSRPFRIDEGEPLPTSYGEDLYRQTFESNTT